MTRDGPVTLREQIDGGRRVAVQPGSVADQHGRLTGKTVAAVIDAGFVRHFVPRRWGGRAGRFGELVDAVAAVAADCPSAAWCAGLWAWHARFAGLLLPPAHEDLWADTADVTISAGLLPPAGIVEPVPGGYRLRGRWTNVSGAEHAAWVLLAAPRPAASPLVVAVPRADWVVERTWAAVGLRASGTDTVVVAGAIVPAHRTIAADRMLSGDPTAAERCHAAPAHLAGGLILAAAAVGAARAGVAAWQATTSGDPALANTVARSSAEVDAAMLLLAHAAQRADDAPITERLVARNRRDAAFATDLAVTAVERLFRSTGGPARDAGSALNRAWRDVHTIAAHGALRFDAAAQAYAAAMGKEHGGDGSVSGLQ